MEGEVTAMRLIRLVPWLHQRNCQHLHDLKVVVVTFPRVVIATCTCVELRGGGKRMAIDMTRKRKRGFRTVVVMKATIIDWGWWRVTLCEGTMHSEE
jgi:hypothetical protein